MPNSLGALLQSITKDDSAFGLYLKDPVIGKNKLIEEPRLQRAIGVIYRPETERESHYYLCCHSKQFEYIVHFPNTNPVIPLVEKEEQKDEMETYPYGL